MTPTLRWFGNAGHFICGHDCRFHLCTLVGKYLVSTVGEYWPQRAVREIHAEVHDPKWFNANRHLKGDHFDHAYMQRFGFETIGWERTFETMVFKAGEPCKCGCGIPSISGESLDFRGYNSAADATSGHMELVEKYGRPLVCEQCEPGPDQDHPMCEAINGASCDCECRREPNPTDAQIMGGGYVDGEREEMEARRDPR